MKYTRLGDLLVDAGYITDEQLNHALTVQKEKHQRLGETLVSEGIITERNLIDALTMQLGIDFIDLTETSIDPEMTRLVSKNLAKRFSVVPVRVRGDELYLAMVDPLNFIAIEEIRAASRKRIVPMIATQSAVDHAISTAPRAPAAPSARCRTSPTSACAPATALLPLSLPTRSPTPLPPCAWSITSSSAPSPSAPPISTSSPTRTTSSCATAWTACCTASLTYPRTCRRP